MAQDDEIVDLFSLAEAAGLSLYQALKHLNALSEAGLVDARRLRLTLPGLAVATALSREEARDNSAVDVEPTTWLLADHAA